MTRSVVATKKQAPQTLKSLDHAQKLIAACSSINNVFENTKPTSGPTSSWSTLQRWLKLTRPTIVKSKSGSFLRCDGNIARAFTNKEEAELAEELLNRSKRNCFLDTSKVTGIAVKFCNKILANEQPSSRKKLRCAMFSKH